MPQESKSCRNGRALGVCVTLVAAVWTVFGQSCGFEFVNFDDPQALYENRHVTVGLSWPGVEHAFTSNEVGHWIPLTVLSRMLDCQLYGLWAGGHHLTNVILHAASAVALFLVLRAMTGALWRSAFVASVFAIHPLRAESVAWVAERKDVLSGLFFMLTLAAYLSYIRVPSAGRYMRMAAMFVCGLMSKSMLVTLPGILLLLDFWPLKRWKTRQNARQLVWEKVPLLALSAGVAAATMIADRGAIKTLVELPLALRVENAAVATTTYLGKMFWPTGLAVFYPHLREGLPAWQMAISVAVLGIVSTGVWRARRSQPYALTGWLWYLAMLVPVIGLVQSGDIARADRYTYLPGIGVAIIVAWGIADICRPLWMRCMLGALATMAAGASILAARAQTRHYRNSITLWEHALSCTEPSALAEDNLAEALLAKGRVAEAIAHDRNAVNIDPTFANAHYNLGLALMQNGELDASVAHYRLALKLRPQMAKAHNDLGYALAQIGQQDEAIAHYREALRIEPNLADTHNNFGIALVRQGKVDEAITEWCKALESNPNYAKAHHNLGLLFFKQGQMNEAIQQWQEAVKLDPDFADAHDNLAAALVQKGRTREAMGHWESIVKSQPSNFSARNELAWVLATSPDTVIRDGQRALELAQQAVKLSGGSDPAILDTLAAAQAECGQFNEAVETAERALALVESQNNESLIVSLRSRIGSYKMGKPFHESGNLRAR